MEMTDRSHRSTSNNAAGELFICFTSRFSSSSMKLSSKSILSPARDSSLSTSLSRRLRPSASLRAAQASPMFPSAHGKKRACAFDNPEPSSPKVTCIGQVRVKTKGKKIGARSKGRGEVSFRKIDRSNSTANNLEMGHLHHSQQECRKWVHLPLTICEALRAIGTEFSCFLPCRSSCMASHREKEEKASAEGGSGGKGRGGSCGAVLARWLVAAVEEGEGEAGKGREIELVVGEEEEEEEEEEEDYDEEEVRSNHRRHVFEDIEINFCENENDREEGRVSICIPPKNALLLMRCRSDPVKMAALANRSWEPAVVKNEENVNEEDEEEEEVKATAWEKEEEEPEIEQCESSEFCKKLTPFEAVEEPEVRETDVGPESIADREEDGESVGDLQETSPDSKVDENRLEDQQETAQESPPEVLEELDKLESDTNVSSSEKEKESDHVEQTAEPEPEPEPSPNVESGNYDNDDKTSSEPGLRESENEEEEPSPVSEEEETEDPASGEKDAETPGTEETDQPDPEENGSKHEESEEKLLPDCLLLMMCEPKLSMEVSKETWVCSTDFIPWQPEKQQKKAVKVKRKDGPDESKRRISVDPNAAQQLLLQPPRSSCSFPDAPPVETAAAKEASGGVSIARMTERKLVGGKGYEPFVLTRCKSEPMRSSAKLAPESCFWKNLKLEPATLGVGAAGVGF